MEALSDADSTAHWKWLYRVAGVAALLSVALILIAGAVFMTRFPPSFQPTADNTRDWFAFFQSHRLFGLFDLDLVMAADNVLVIPVFLALYVALRRVSESWVAMGATTGLVGIAGYWAVNPAFSMLSLSDQYAAATTEAERAALVAAGRTLLAVYQGTGFNVYLLLLSAGSVIVSAVMLRGKTFGRTAGVAGIVANGLAPGMFLPVVGLYLGWISLLPLLVWYVLVGRTLLQLGRGLPAMPGESAPDSEQLRLQHIQKERMAV